MTNRQIENRIQKIKKLEAQKKDLEKEISAVQDELKAEMESRKVNELSGNTGKATWISFTTNRFDGKAFKTDHAEMYAMYTKATPSRRFTIA